MGSKKQSMACFRWLTAAALLATAAGCCFPSCDSDSDDVEDHLRGPRSRSPDGGTTLTIVDISGCVLTVDGKRWRYPLGVAGPVTPGRHTVTCANTLATIDVETPKGIASTLDYWGP